MHKIDARGLACPAPVLQTKSILESHQPQGLHVTVDNAAAQQNVQRFLESQGFHTTLNQEGSDYFVTAAAGDHPTEKRIPQDRPKPAAGKVMVMCATDRIGFGDDNLGKQLMISFLKTLLEMGPELWRLVLVNNGVKLTIDDSQALDELHRLEQNGTKILVCGTCLNHFDLMERKRVGETTNMLDIVTAMQLANKVINI